MKLHWCYTLSFDCRGEIMQVKCTICDQIESIEDHCFEAKRLRNRRIHMYLCNDCYNRIEEKTLQRHATGKFRLYEEKKAANDFI
jgi:uncharacterized protein YlaI